MFKRFLSALTLFLAIAGTVVADPVQDPVVTAAKAWLKMVDDKDYAASWADAAKLFKDRVTQEKWVAEITIPRSQLGGLKSRKFESFQQMTSLPDAPDGDYAVVIFATVFENKPDSKEQIALVHEGDQWKVGGYYIK
jgi:hypothetical protein